MRNYSTDKITLTRTNRRMHGGSRMRTKTTMDVDEAQGSGVTNLDRLKDALGKLNLNNGIIRTTKQYVKI